VVFIYNGILVSHKKMKFFHHRWMNGNGEHHLKWS
jgi:hypothetical protein